MSSRPAIIKFPWYSQLGTQRDWVWRGWRIRYTYLRSQQPNTQNSPLVFLHGFGAALDQWRYNLQPFSQDHPVYALDMLGFGASEKAAATYNVELWVTQVYEFWRTLIGKPIVLVGHSLGALVALTCATLYPDMVQGLILLTVPASRQEVLPKGWQAWIGNIESAFASPILLKPLFNLLISNPGLLRTLLKTAYANPDLVTEELVTLFATPPQDRGARGVFCRLSKARTRRDFSLSVKEMLPQLDLPTLMLWGQQDRIIPIAWGRQLIKLHPKIEFVEIEQAGHCPYDEHPEQVNQEIAAWLHRHQFCSPFVKPC